VSGEIALASPLAALIAGLADNKYFLGRRYAEWCTAAPALESAVAAAAMAQDEIGHARSLYPLLQDISGISGETVPETRTQFTNAEFLGQAFAGWTDFVAANFLFDTAMSIVLEAARASVFEALGQRARRMLEEEHLHWLHGEGWTRRLAREGPAVRSPLQRSFTRAALDALAWFDLAVDGLVEDGTLEIGASELRVRYCARVNPVLQAVGLREVE
jgi:ring-1,2-phenylacetyl-CoA epoxidase subunit PaaC